MAPFSDSNYILLPNIVEKQKIHVPGTRNLVTQFTLNIRPLPLEKNRYILPQHLLALNLHIIKINCLVSKFIIVWKQKITRERYNIYGQMHQQQKKKKGTTLKSRQNLKMQLPEAIQHRATEHDTGGKDISILQVVMISVHNDKPESRGKVRTSSTSSPVFEKVRKKNDINLQKVSISKGKH